MSGHWPRRPRSRREGGQSLVEFTLIVPLFLMILFGMIEFGFVFTHDLTVEYATREGARQAYPGRRLVAVFQQHLYSRTALHGVALGKALWRADVVVVTDVYAARELPIEGVTGRIVAEAAERPEGEVHWVASRKDLVEHVASLVRAGDVVLTLGAGDVTVVGRELLARLAQRQGAAL